MFDTFLHPESFIPYKFLSIKNTHYLLLANLVYRNHQKSLYFYTGKTPPKHKPIYKTKNIFNIIENIILLIHLQKT